MQLCMEQVGWGGRGNRVVGVGWAWEWDGRGGVSVGMGWWGWGGRGAYYISNPVLPLRRRS